MLAAAVALPIALFGYVAWHDREGYLARGAESAWQTAQILHEHALKIFETDELAMDRLEDRIAGLAWRQIGEQERTLHDTIGGIAAAHEQIATMGLVDPTGRFVLTGEYPTRPVDVGDRDYIQAMLTGYRGTYIGIPIIGRFTGKAQFATARPRRSETGQFDGALVVSVDPDYFVEFWQTIIGVD